MTTGEEKNAADSISHIPVHGSNQWTCFSSFGDDGVLHLSDAAFDAALLPQAEHDHGAAYPPVQAACPRGNQWPAPRTAISTAAAPVATTSPRHYSNVDAAARDAATPGSALRRAALDEQALWRHPRPLLLPVTLWYAAAVPVLYVNTEQID